MPNAIVRTGARFGQQCHDVGKSLANLGGQALGECPISVPTDLAGEEDRLAIGDNAVRIAARPRPGVGPASG